MEHLRILSAAVALIGVGVIGLGVIFGIINFVRTEFRARGASGLPVGRVPPGGGSLDVSEARRQLRSNLGYYLLLGLEFLIAADVIETLMKPSAHELIILGTIVVIRTLISYSLHAELSHQ